ncbi:hypothetical protein BC628DRAFT_1340313 [Trametes gibbosa]|nr:hypothetical protein BC628DRAFT_1340313 [Trametes gibbosa]
MAENLVDNEPVSVPHIQSPGKGPWNAPISITENSSQTFGFGKKDAKSRYARLGSEAMATTLGPMPVEKFLDAFLPCPDLPRGMPSPTNAFSGIKNNKTESSIYLPLITALNEHKTQKETLRGARCPGFSFRQTANHPDKSGGDIGSIKPDICCYANRHLRQVATAGTDRRRRDGHGPTAGDDYFNDIHGQAAETTDRESWVFVLGKYTGTQSTSKDNALRDFGQSVAYAVQICTRQYRVFCFSLTVSGTRDRHRTLDIVAELELLCQFFWRFTHVSDAARGYDLTVNAATKAEEELFRTTAAAHVARQLFGADPEAQKAGLNIHYMPDFVTSIHHIFPSTDDAAEEHPILLVSRPMSSPLSMVGRSTRAYWAVAADGSLDHATSASVFVLKDTWRIAGPGDMVQKLEGDILLSLQQQGVQNIIPCEAHGDVPIVDALQAGPRIDVHGGFVLQETLTDRFIDKWWVCGRRDVLRRKVIKRVHYRLLLGLAGFNLLHMSGTAELLTATYHAFQGDVVDAQAACKSAYEVAGRLHRDVTPANIILYRDTSNPTCSKDVRQGYLIDWDQSCDSTEAAALGNQPSNMLDRNEDLMGGRVGGSGKIHNISRRRYTGDIVWSSDAMQTWIDTVCDYLQPLPHTPPDRVGKWTVVHFDRFWSRFLASTTLPTQDSKNFIAANLRFYARTAPQAVIGSVSQPTTSWGSKRAMPDTSSSEAELPSHGKRRRVRKAGTVHPQHIPPLSISGAVGPPLTMSEGDSPQAGPSSKVLGATDSYKESEVDPPAQRPAKKLRVDPKSLTALWVFIQLCTTLVGIATNPDFSLPFVSNLCKAEYREKHPNATQAEFESYYKTCSTAELEASAFSR